MAKGKIVPLVPFLEWLWMEMDDLQMFFPQIDFTGNFYKQWEAQTSDNRQSAVYNSKSNRLIGKMICYGICFQDSLFNFCLQ